MRENFYKKIFFFGTGNLFSKWIKTSFLLIGNQQIKNLLSSVRNKYLVVRKTEIPSDYIKTGRLNLVIGRC